MKYISRINKTEIEEFIYDAKGRMVKSSFVCPGCGNQMSEGWCFQRDDQYIMLCKPCKKLVSDEVKHLKKERRKAEAQAKAAAEAALLVPEPQATLPEETTEGTNAPLIEESISENIRQEEPFIQTEESTSEQKEPEDRQPVEEDPAGTEAKTEVIIPKEPKATGTDEGVAISEENTETKAEGKIEEKAEDETQEKREGKDEIKAEQGNNNEQKAETTVPPVKPKAKSRRSTPRKQQETPEVRLASPSEPAPFSIIFLEEDEENFKEYLKSHSSVEESTYPNIIRYLRRLKEFQWISHDKTMNFPTLHPENVSIYVDNLKHISGGEDLSEVWLLSYFRLYLYFKRNEERMKNRPKKTKPSVTPEKKETPKVKSPFTSYAEAETPAKESNFEEQEESGTDKAEGSKLPVLQSWRTKQTNIKNAIIDFSIHSLDKFREKLVKWRN